MIVMSENLIPKELVKIREIDDHPIIVRNHSLDRHFHNIVVAMVVGGGAKKLPIFFIAKFGDAKSV